MTPAEMDTAINAWKTRSAEIDRTTKRMELEDLKIASDANKAEIAREAWNSAISDVLEHIERMKVAH